MPRGRPKKEKLSVEEVMHELAKHEAECTLRYKRIEEILGDQKNQLKGLDIRMWGLGVLIIGAAVAQKLL